MYAALFASLLALAASARVEPSVQTVENQGGHSTGKRCVPGS